MKIVGQFGAKQARRARLATILSFVLAATTALVAAEKVVGDGQEVGDLGDSATARAAKAKYDAAVETTRKDYEKKIALLRQEYERKIITARTALVGSLRRAEAEEAKKGKAADPLAPSRAGAALRHGQSMPDLATKMSPGRR